MRNIIVLFCCMAFCAVSCQKSSKEDPFLELPLTEQVRVEFRRDSIDFYSTFDVQKYNFRQSLSRIIHWDRAREKTDTVIVPITLKLPEGQINSATGDAALRHKVFLIAFKGSASGYTYKMLTYIGDAVVSLKEFSGTVYYEDYFEGRVKYKTYDRGYPLDTRHDRLSPYDRVASVKDGLVGYGMDCDWTKVATVCVGDPQNEDAPFVCTDRYEYQCSWDRDDFPDIEDEVDDSDSGDAGGGGGGSSNKPTTQQLKNQIKDKPFALFGDLDCEIVKKWLATATHQVQQAQINKLNTIINSHTTVHGNGAPGITYQMIATVQDINDAYSTVVNMDYFPITVNQLPVVNGQRLTAPQFLEHIRTNINGFVNTNYSEFEPYSWYGVNDAALWNSSNPLNAVIAIDIKGPDNGSVIVSKYSSTGWTFTTIYDPKYGTHPVSGNRDFGYIQNPNGSYTFYTRGVDRLTEFTGTFVQWATNYPFSQADALWISFQQKITNFVNTHQGQARVALQEIQRPKWQHIKDVIDGKKPLSSLSTDCKD